MKHFDIHLVNLFITILFLIQKKYNITFMIIGDCNKVNKV